MSANFTINGTYIKKGFPVFVYDGTLIKSGKVTSVCPRIDDCGKKQYDFTVEIKNQPLDIHMLGIIYPLNTLTFLSDDPFIDQKIFPSHLAAQAFVTMPFKDGDKAYFLNANPSKPLLTSIEEVTIVVNPDRKAVPVSNGDLSFELSAYRMKFGNGQISDELFYNAPEKNLFSTYEEAEEERTKLINVMTTINIVQRALTFKQLNLKSLPTPPEGIPETVFPVFQNFVVNGTIADIDNLRIKIYNILSRGENN